MSHNLGVFKPPEADLFLAGIVLKSGGRAVVHVQEINKYAGAAIGNAVISYPAAFAVDADPELGKEARLKIGGKTVFRGVVGQGPFDIGPDSDEIVLVLFDDKWLIASKTIGQIGVGTQGDPAGTTGFKDVGFEVIFNRDGRPNKDPASIEFNTGSTAVYWTCKTIMQFLFGYVDATVATLDDDLLSGDGYARIPTHVNLIGQQVHQAIDTVAQLAGESWGLVPGSAKSEFIPVRPGSGTQRTVRLFKPKAGARSTSSNKYHAVRCSVPKSIRSSRDLYQAVSAPIVKEHTYSSVAGEEEGDPEDPLLLRAASFADKSYAARFYVDVTKYADYNLGSSLSAGSTPKPWLAHLVTRISADGSAYVTAAQIAADDTLRGAQRIQKPFVWLATDGDKGNARLVDAGHRIDLDHGTIDFKATLDLMADTGDDPEDVAITDWSTVGIWLTVATVLEIPESVETASGSQYLPVSFCQVISKSDLAPERRQLADLPDLAGNNNAITTEADPDEEEYIDITTRLQDAINSAIAASPAVETPVTVELPFVPLFEIGDLLAVSGRAVGASGDEAISSISYKFTEGVPSMAVVNATNVPAAIDPDNYLEPE